MAQALLKERCQRRALERKAPTNLPSVAAAQRSGTQEFRWPNSSLRDVASIAHKRAGRGRSPCAERYDAVATDWGGKREAAKTRALGVTDGGRYARNVVDDSRGRTPGRGARRRRTAAN